MKARLSVGVAGLVLAATLVVAVYPTGSIAGASSSYNKAPATAPGVTSKTIKIGLIADLTGTVASTFGTSAQGVQAYFKMINAEGGIDGRKLQLLTADTASSASQGLTAAQSLVSRGVFAIISNSTVSPLDNYRYLHSEGVPVVGACFDGADWSDPSTSWYMFAWDGCDGQYPAVTTWESILKDMGVTKLASFAYENVATDTADLKNISAVAKRVGIPTVYQGLNIQFTTSNFSPAALAVKSSGANGVVGSLAQSQVLALSSALLDSGYKGKQLYLGGGYDPTTFASPTSKAAAEGSYYTSPYQPIETGTPAAKKWSQEMKKYGNITGVPPFGFATAWVSASLLVAGLEAAGKGVTRQSYVNVMHSLKGWNAGGLVETINYAKDWGGGAMNPVEANNCVYVVKVVGSSFVPQNKGKPYCGVEIPSIKQFPTAVTP